MRRLAVTVMVMTAALLAGPLAGRAHAAPLGVATAQAVGAPPSAAAATGPRYDVPSGFTRCPRARAWNGFFKWASVQRTSCRRAAAFMREYAEHADGPSMPRRVGDYTCRIHFWRNDEGDVYASRHVCTRGSVTIRFYGMV